MARRNRPGRDGPFAALARLAAATGAPAPGVATRDGRRTAPARGGRDAANARRERDASPAARSRHAADGRDAAGSRGTPSAGGDADGAADDRALFLAAVGPAVPLAHRHGPLPPPKPTRESISDDQLALAELEDLVAGHGPFRVSDAEERHTGLAPGVSFTLLRQLERGAYAHARHLDLHGCSRDAAHAALIAFIQEAQREGERCVLVITGRGRRSPDGRSILREALPRWLTRAPLGGQVLAFCTARPTDGGPGAFYVLLRRAGAPR